MFKGIKKVLAGFLAAAIALTPVSSAFAATSPAVKIIAITENSAKPLSSNVKKQIDRVYTSEKGYTLIEHVTKTATTVTYNTRITVKNGNAVDNKGNVVSTKQDYAYTINGVRTNAFINASNVTTVTLGTTCRKLEHYAFDGAISLKKIVLKSTKLTTVGKYLLGKPGTKTAVDPSQVHVYVSGKYFKTHKAELKALKLKLKEKGFWAKNIHMSNLF